MSYRWILFGYQVENNKYVVVSREAAVVQRIFDLYISGTTLQNIANIFTAEKTPYNEAKCTWNKNMISRIIENSHYVGDNEYPQIISNEIFETANNRKNNLGGRREKDSPEIKYIKSVLRCSNCGGKVRRLINYSTRTKWVCDNKCKVAEFFDDDLLFSKITSIINQVIQNTNLLDLPKTAVTQGEPGIDVVRKTNEFKKMLEQSEVQFTIAKTMLFESIERKFECCCLDDSVYTKPLQEYLGQQTLKDSLNVSLLSTTVNQIYINLDGSITVCFINGKKLNGDGNAEYFSKNSYKDRG